MREILFRGKRTDNGTWAYGYLFCIWERTYLCWGTTNDVPNMKEVIPETVGQYTGLTDKNGVKTFEVRKYDRDFRVGDILILKEYNGEYTGKSVTMRICYALSDPDFVKDGYVILGIQGV